MAKKTSKSVMVPDSDGGIRKALDAFCAAQVVAPSRSKVARVAILAGLRTLGGSKVAVAKKPKPRPTPTPVPASNPDED